LATAAADGFGGVELADEFFAVLGAEQTQLGLDQLRLLGIVVRRFQARGKLREGLGEELLGLVVGGFVVLGRFVKLIAGGGVVVSG